METNEQQKDACKKAQGEIRKKFRGYKSQFDMDRDLSDSSLVEEFPSVWGDHMYVYITGRGIVPIIQGTYSPGGPFLGFRSTKGFMKYHFEEVLQADRENTLYFITAVELPPRYNEGFTVIAYRINKQELDLFLGTV